MPLPTPILDDRSYQQLRDELVRRIPVYNPDWTDYNASDPGITLIELFAFLGENLLFRFNQIPDATRLAFLRLLNIPLRAATPSQGLVCFTTRSSAGDLVPTASEAQAGDISFETQHEVDVLPLTCVVGAKLASAPPQTREEVDATQAARVKLGQLAANESVAYYRTEWLEDATAPRAKPLNAAHAVDGMIWIGVLRTRYTSDSALNERILNLGFVPEQEVASMDEVDPCAGATTDPPPTVLWQASSPSVNGTRKTPEYLKLSVLEDSTAGLTRAGVVRLQLPRDITTLGPPEDIDFELEGAGELPPVIEDEEIAGQLMFWLRASRIKDDRAFTRIRWIGLNATELIQQRRANPEFLGFGSGQPAQQFSLVYDNVSAGTLVLQVEEGGAWRTWREVSMLEASRPDDRDYVLDPESGTVRFGNGTCGRTPQMGERIRALEYRYGGGVAGNVGAKAITRVVQAPQVKAENPLPMRGGAERETLAEALDRVPGEVRRHDRAVTSSDFAELALQTPGALVGRAETMALFHPPSKKDDAAGVVTVVVWPREDARNPGAPMPDRAVLLKVCEYLNARRLITTELWVIPPTYRKIAVSVAVNVKSGYGVEAVRRWVELVLRQYLAPLPPYGPEGKGWPLGRRVHGPELEAAVLQVEGVAFIEQDLRIAFWNSTTSRWVEAGPTVLLNTWEVPELWEITVVEDEPLEPGRTVGPIAPVQVQPEFVPVIPPGFELVGTEIVPKPGTSIHEAPGPNRPKPLAVPIPVPKTEC